jgi:YfiH family protein
MPTPTTPQINLFFTSKTEGNLAFHVGDHEADVINNHKLLAKKLNYNIDKLVYMKQIHSDIVHVLNSSDDFYNPPTCDALVTNKKDTPIMVMVADCSPVLFYDDIRGVIAVAHAGREGAFKNIVQKTISTMVSEFNSKVKNIYVKIGANIDVCCYEVGKEIYDEGCKLGYKNSFEARDKCYFLDIDKILKKQLLACGIDKNSIETCGECTCCTTTKYYSYRAEKNTGRFSGVIYLKNDI